MAQIYVAGMVALELALPMMIVIGFYARAAALLLMGHQLVFWIGAQPPDQYGAILHASPFDMVPDQLRVSQIPGR